ncbi:hypothetical protein [Maioricimonas sp. JC845]|uniref:hypothetical protein n=1 Tax=Maioricimonas sp. JC845 TaxID=3232138 RepID=UPI00345852F4
MLLLLISGCAQVEQSGEATVVRHSWLSVLAIFAIGVALLVFGACITKESMGDSGSAKKPRRKSRSGKEGAKKKEGSRKGALIGLVLSVAGMLVLALGVPSAWDASVTISPDRVVFRDALFWWENEPRTFDYASLTNIEVEVEELPIQRRGRKEKEYLVLSGTMVQDRREMNSLLRGAYPILLEAWQNYRAGNGPIAEAAPTPGLPSSSTVPDSPPSDPFSEDADGRDFKAAQAAARMRSDRPESTEPVEPAGPLTPIPSLGPYRKGVTVMAPRNGREAPAELVEVYRERYVRVRFREDGEEVVLPMGRMRVIRAGEAAAMTTSSEDLTPVESIGRYVPGGFVMARVKDGNFVRSEILEVYQEQRLRVRYEGDGSNETAIVPISQARPAAPSTFVRPGEGPGREIASTSGIRPGMTLLGHYEGRWLEVEVIEVTDRRIKIRWPGEPWRESVPLSWLRVPD